MEYHFSLVSFIIGIIMLVPSALLVKYATKIADAFGGSYSRYQIYSYVAVGVSFLVMFNIHAWLAGLIANTFFGGIKG